MKNQLIAFVTILVFVVSTFSGVPGIMLSNKQGTVAPNNGVDPLLGVPPEAAPALSELLNEQTMNYPSDYDIGKVLSDRENVYSEIYEPWKSKAAIHAIAYDEATGFLALGGGYLYDNEVHIFRLNMDTGKFDKVWDSGDSIIQSDVLSLAFGDTDLNSFLEIVAGSADGHVYVFEQDHIYDPYTNTENRFSHVWTSPSMFRVFDVKVEDVDRDYRPDIIAGTWDGLFLFEYDEHSGYPFVEEHWITYRNVWSSPVAGEKIYSLEAGDTNENGLSEIIVGTRSGTVYVYENNGVTLWINGQPFPLVRDNDYYLNWTSENYTWSPIRSMAVGELDGTPGDELVLIAQGQGVFSLDWNSTKQTYDYRKIYRDYKPWETFGFWGLDYWADSVLSANNVTYHDPLNASINVQEPIQYVWGGSYFIPDASVYPFNTGMAGPPDGNFSTFDSTIANVDNASAIVDFGLDEEGTGSANADPDVLITFSSALDANVFSRLNLSLSRYGSEFEQISVANWRINGNVLEVDVDDALQNRQWDFFRYLKITVFNGGNYDVNSLQLMQVYNLLTDALSLTIGPLRFDSTLYWNDVVESNKILIGTVTGKFIAVEWNEALSSYQVIWDSGEDDRYATGTGIWDITHIPTTTDIPIYRWLKRLGGLFVEPTLSPGIGVEYNQWSFGTLDPFGIVDPTPNYFIGTNASHITALDMWGSPDSIVQGYLSPVNSHLVSEDKPYISVETPWLQSNQFYGHPAVVVASYNPDIPLTGNVLEYPRATIDFFYRESSSVTSAYTGMINIRNTTIDPTGEVSSLIALSTTTPKMSFVDYDSDVDLDMVFSNGKLYLAKNLIAEFGGYYANNEFVIVRDYFKQVNDAVSAGGWGQPQLFDLDQDGDLDLILSYASKSGATVFLNHGTNEKPDWVQQKSILSNLLPETSLRYLNLTDTRVIKNNVGSSYDYWQDLFHYEGADYSLVSYQIPTHQTYWFEPVYDSVDSYMVATYPEVARTEFGLIHSQYNNDFKNFGFHVRESWSNTDDLDGWTMSISSGDIDGDGKGEIIVGSYDNNVYAFENLYNSSFKRMYKTFDLNHTEMSNSSPYFYQELEGISGDFNRKIWDDATNLLVDVDLDQDGLKEMIVTTDVMVYVFEDKGLFGGDEMQFVYSFDIRDSSFFDDPLYSGMRISAIAAGNDLDYDGRMELVLAAGAILFVFNVDEGSFDNFEDNGLFTTSYTLQGRYFLIGNPMANPDLKYAQINAIAIGDTDKDSYREIIIGGVNDTRYSLQDGFLNIYESQGGTFYQVWTAPSVLTQWNPVTALAIDDQDYDTNLEIIVGHSKGFDMWEHIPGTDSEYMKVEHVTASPNYPIIDTKFLAHPSDTVYDVSDRGTSDLVNGKGSYSNYVMQVYTNKTRLWWKTYDKTTNEWGPSQQLFTSVYTSFSLKEEVQPSIATMPNGDIYAAWRTESISGEAGLWLAKFNIITEVWGAPVAVSGELLDLTFYYPEVFEYDDTNLGVLFTYSLAPVASYLGVYLTSKTLPGTYSGGFLLFQDYDFFYIHSSAITRLPDNSFVIAFAAQNFATGKHDYDIWSLHLNSTFSFEDSVAHQATTAYEDELYPDVDYLRSEEGSLVIVYENIASPLEDRIGIVSSVNGGLSWKRSDTLNALPPNVVRVEDLALNTVYYTIANTVLPAPQSMAPTIVGLDGEGFMYAFVFTWGLTKFSLFDYQWWFGYPQYGINTESDWTGNSIRAVVDLATSDTDNDGRREVIAGFENQVGVYELGSSTNGTGFMAYNEAWLSAPFENSVTGVTAYDTNGNGFAEIGISTGRGDVYLLEFSDPSSGATELVFSQERWQTDLNTYGSLINLDSFDIDGDSKDEIIGTGYNAGIAYGIDDDGSIMWTNNDAGALFFAQKLVDINGDMIPELIATSFDGYIYAFDALTGTQLWNYTDGTIFYMIAAGDLNGDGQVEVVTGSSSGSLYILDADGNFLNQYAVSPNDVFAIAIGNFTLTDQLTIVFGDAAGRLKMVYSGNGTIYYESPLGTISSVPSDIVLSDFNDDNVTDVIFGSDRLHILDPTTGIIYYNSTDYGIPWWHIFVDDFDGDGVKEVLSLTLTSGLYLEEILSSTTQWHYAPSLGQTWDAAIGDFDNSGTPDIALVSDSGEVIAIDGRSGAVIYFDVLAHSARSVTAADLDGDGFYSIVAWSAFTGNLTAIDRLDPVYVETPSPYVIHTDYLEVQTGDKKNTNMWSVDLGGDGRGEIVLTNDHNELLLYNATNGQLIWNQTMLWRVGDVQFGQFDGFGDLDLAVWVKSTGVFLLKGETGEEMGMIPEPAGFTITSIAAGEFVTTQSGDEVVALFQRAVPTEAYVAWFDGSGSELFKGNFNETNIGNHLAVGHYLGGTWLDVAIGGYGGTVWVYRGATGELAWSLGLGPTIYDIITGNFDGDSYEDIAVLDSSSDVTVIKSNTGLPAYLVPFEAGFVREIGAADLYLHDGIDELVVNVIDIGVVAYDISGLRVWEYEAPLILGPYDATMTFGDWGGDGVTDLVYTNYNYINIVNGTDGRLLWHYEGTGRLWGLSVDNYALPTGPEDIAYTGLYSFHIVSGNLIPPMAPAIPSSPPPLVASGAELTWLNLIPWAISILALGIISTIMYKKRKYLIFGRSAVRTVNY